MQALCLVSDIPGGQLFKQEQAHASVVPVVCVRQRVSYPTTVSSERQHIQAQSQSLTQPAGCRLLYTSYTPKAAGSLQKHVQDAARILGQQLAGEAHGLQRLCVPRSRRSAGMSFSSSKDPILASATAMRPWAYCVTLQDKDVAHTMQPAGVCQTCYCRHVTVTM